MKEHTAVTVFVSGMAVILGLGLLIVVRMGV